jgi:hypothetical protein
LQDKSTQRSQSKRKKTHALLRDAPAHFAHTRNVENDGYLKPYKQNLVDITCSQAGLQHALTFANVLFLAMEAKGFHVGIFGGQLGSVRRPPIDPLDSSAKRSGHNPHDRLWHPGRLTVAQVNGQRVGLSIVEVAEAVVMRYVGNGYVPEAEYIASKARSRYRDSYTWTTTMERPSGRLRLQAYAPHYLVEHAKQWMETASSPLVNQVPEIVAGIETMAATLGPLIAQAERQMEAERLRYKAERRQYQIQEDKRRIRESTKESLDQLDSIIHHWADMRARSDFLTRLEQDVARLSEPERASIQARITLARDLLGPSDPMPRFLEWRAPAERYAPKHFGEEG